ncbi:MAG: carbamoyltransferase [Lysobacterales bacterium]
MRILGISAFYHDSAAALVEDGQIVAAAQEERFSRVKHDPDWPAQAIAACLAQAGCTLADVDRVAYYEKPLLKFERLLETHLATAPRGFAAFAQAMPVWLKEKLFLKPLIVRKLSALAPGIDWESRLLFSEHHLSHAASAFYPSPFERAAVLTLDGVGEWCSTSLGFGEGADLRLDRELQFPHSLGLLYSAFTYYCGFKVNAGEYKLMGLAPYGEPRFAQSILDHLIDLKADGSFRLDLRYFDYVAGLRMTNARFDSLFGGPPRAAESALTQRHMDLAASIQAVTEEVVLRLGRDAAQRYGRQALCLAGGVALNCVANGKLLRDGCFDQIWIQPAAGDAGGALGAALAAWHLHHGQPRSTPAGDAMRGGYLGPSYAQADIEARLRAVGAMFEVMDDDAALTRQAAADLADGHALGWFQGAMEFGPRALGGRSILADPRRVEMQRTLNLKVKFRESFRPFAPAVQREAVADWFDLDADSPYMLLVAEVAAQRLCSTDSPSGTASSTSETSADPLLARLYEQRSEIPAVTHVDGSARVQTVDAQRNPLFHRLLGDFRALTGCPVLVNTSFNVRGEPIVGSPEDAFRCFMGTDIERLAVGRCYLRKDAQTAPSTRGYERDFKLD